MVKSNSTHFLSGIYQLSNSKSTHIIRRRKNKTMVSINTRFYVFLLSFTAVVTAFTPNGSTRFVPSTTVMPATSSSRLYMFSGDEGEGVKPLAEVTAGDDDDESSTSTAAMDTNIAEPAAFAKNLGRGGGVEEVKWVDPAMEANTNPLNMSAWAYILFGLLPGVLIANDFLHFIPESAKDGPLGFLL